MLPRSKCPKGACNRSLLLLAALLGVVAIRWADAVTVEPTAAAPAVRSRQGRQLLVNTDPIPSTAPKTTPFDNTLQLGGPDISHLDKRVRKRGLACDAPNQVHLTLWTATSVLVSWVTCDYQTGPSVTGPRPTPGFTHLSYWRAQWQCDGFGYYPAYTEVAMDEYDSTREDEEADVMSLNERPVGYEEDVEAVITKYRRYPQHKYPQRKNSQPHPKYNYAKEHKSETHKEPSYKAHKDLDYLHNMDDKYGKSEEEYYGGRPHDKHYKADDEYTKSHDKHYKADDEYAKSHDKHYKADDEYYKSDDKYYRSGDKYPKSDDEYYGGRHHDKYYKHDDDHYYQGRPDHCGKPIKVEGVTTSYYYDYSPTVQSFPPNNIAEQNIFLMCDAVMSVLMCVDLVSYL